VLAYGSRPRSRASGLFLVGLLIPLSAVLAWDRLRGGAPFWIQQTINYGGIRLVYPGEVMPRLAGWASFLPHLLGWPMTVTAAIGLPLLLVHDLTSGARTQAATLDLILVTFAIGYFLVHWLLAFPVWDRYLLGLVPVACLLIGRLAKLAASILEQIARRQNLRAERVVLIIIVALLALSAAQAWQNAAPVGGDHGPHDGIDHVAAFLYDLPSGAVVYDHWLGWVLRYYQWDASVYIAYFATPQTLAEDLHVFGRSSPRYIVFPANESTTRVERAIATEGFEMTPVLSTRDRHSQPTFALYRIDPNGNH